MTHPFIRSHAADGSTGIAASHWLVAALGFLLCGGAWAQAAPEQQPSTQSASYAPSHLSGAVGEITLVVGPATRTSANGVPETVQRGSRVMPGDRFDTAGGGMLHIRFVDGALVSLRPGSRLWVEDYRYDPHKVAQSLVRFRLDRGVARAISGAAAEGAKERFRLNTPLVAIGVRGTDFVVRTSEQVTTAAVNQGAIVMAPFDVGCLAQALGPCTSAGAKLLSADMGHLLVEFRPQLSQPEIRPVQSLVAQRAENESAGAPPAAPGPGAAGGRTSPPAADEAVAANLVRDLVRTASAPAPVPPVPPVQTIPEPPPITIPVPPPQLQWGRWDDSVTNPGDLAVTHSQARQGRAVTVGDAYYVLYRTENGATTLNPGLGAYEFNLQQSQAQFNLAGQALAAAVESGKLNVDFVNRQFSTFLSVTSAPTGKVGIAGGGFVRDDGIFFDRSTAGQVIAGATALDGKTAGYFFEKAAAGGTLTGITLWSRP